MPMDYPVFEPGDKELADIIVRILEKKGYQAAYQRSYPQHRVFIKADNQEEVNKISRIIEGFMQRFKREESGPVAYEYDQNITQLGRLIPDAPKKNRDNLIRKTKEEIERDDW